MADTFYVADTGNNRVLLYTLAPNNPISVWTNMTADIAIGDITGALTYYSIESVDDYRDVFLAVGVDNAVGGVKLFL